MDKTMIDQMQSDFESLLKENLESLKDSSVKTSMAYSLLAQGKRLRPRLLLALLFDLSDQYEPGLYPAIALEMIHNYSLVHDDLPAMDDDDYRRHRLTNHKVYGEAIAILAGDGLLTYAFETVCKTNTDARKIVDCVNVLAKTAGAEGMILGQELDIENKMTDLDSLFASYHYKTGQLFSAAFEMAVILADQKAYLPQAQHLGSQLGIYFQVQDDLLEHTQSFETIGKKVDSDLKEEKVTVVTLLGLEKAQALSKELEMNMIETLQAMPTKNNATLTLIDEIVSRTF